MRMLNCDAVSMEIMLQLAVNSDSMEFCRSEEK